MPQVSVKTFQMHHESTKPTWSFTHLVVVHRHALITREEKGGREGMYSNMRYFAMWTSVLGSIVETQHASIYLEK